MYKELDAMKTAKQAIDYCNRNRKSVINGPCCLS